MEQINLFEVLYERYKITKPIRLIELFGGIGSQAKALEVLQQQGKLPMGFEHYRLVEYNKYPVASYNAIHHTNFNPTDITKIHAKDLSIRERERFEYIMTYSFPCQDLSIGNKNAKGLEGKRSGLLYEVERLLNECENELPQVLLLENVFTLVGDKYIDDFNKWKRFLESKGYSNYYKILNAKDYGMPQNRQRCFMVSILGNAYYEFPKPISLKTRDYDLNS
jgi:DNA (cytosine-5)-methyltransferase 1